MLARNGMHFGSIARPWQRAFVLRQRLVGRYCSDTRNLAYRNKVTLMRVGSTSASVLIGSPIMSGGLGSCCEGQKSDIYQVPQRTVKGMEQNTMITTFTKFLKRMLRRIKRALWIFVRAMELMALAMPLVILYPFAKLGIDHSSEGDEAIQEWWLRLCLTSVERAGAAIIKLMQWASSRPDVFGRQFCDLFSKLQDEAIPHNWEHTCHILAIAYGENWSDNLELEEVIGSGCIGQVYKGFYKKESGERQAVAVKVMHPNVRWAIDSDLELLRFLITTTESFPYFFEKLQFFNLNGIVDEFASILKLQLDFRVEAENLSRFNENFADNPNIRFPVVIRDFIPQSNVFVESYEVGEKITDFVARKSEDETLLKELCDLGIKTMIKMIFEHNFVHGDLHPGNILVSENNELILLDAGIALEYTNDDHDLMINVLSSFIRNKGRRAAKYMLSDSNTRLFELEKAARNEQEYIMKIEKITTDAHSGAFFIDNLGYYVGEIFEAARLHHVIMNPAFVSMALATKVQEGVALMLTREADVLTTAIPIISNIEVQRKMGKLLHRSSGTAKSYWRNQSSMNT